MVNVINWIITTIRIHIESNEVSIGIHSPIRIQEPSPRRNVVSGLEIIHAGIYVIVIPAITERVVASYNAGFSRCYTGWYRGGKISPSIIDIGANHRAAFIVDGYDIALHVFDEVERIEKVFRIGGQTILQSDGRTAPAVNESEWFFMIH